MEKRKKDFGLLFAAVLLLIAGTVGIVFAAGESSTMDVSSVAVTATSGGVSTSTNLTLITDGTATTAGIETNAFVDSDIVVKFSQYVADVSNTKTKINLQKIKTDGTLSSSLINEDSISVYNKNVTINPSANLSNDSYYMVTVSPGISSSGGAISSTTTYQAIFKTGSESLAVPASTTFSAILTSPTPTGFTITDQVNKSSAVFNFTFSDAVSNNALKTAGIVTVTKVSGGSQSVASNGAIVASADGGQITLPSGTGSSTTKTMTVNSASLEESATYELKISSALISATAKTLDADVIYTFTTAADSGTPAVTFSAISLYPASGAKDVAVNVDLVIGFTEPITASNNITNGKAVELLDTVINTTLSAVFTLSSDATTITINPNSNLTYGRNYQINILNGKITKAADGSALDASTIAFKTTSFSQVTASAVTSGTSGAAITITLNNASADSQNVKIAYVARRDKGARLEDGGTVVVKGITAQSACAAGQTTTLTINIADITLDQFGNSLSRTTFLDLYLQNNSGDMLWDPIHITVE